MSLDRSSPWRIAAGFASDVGQHRQRNEDAYFVRIPVADGSEPSWVDAILAVADGMGGHEAGDVASRYVIDSLDAAFVSGGDIAVSSDEELPTRLERLFDRINTEMRALSDERGAIRGMGSTFTLVVISGGRLHLAHVGDSRLYRLREDRLSQISDDHSWAAEQRRKGLITPEEEANHPQKNLLTECIGVDRRINIQLHDEPLVPGDRFLICSDGLHGPVDKVVIESLLAEEKSPQRAVDRLIDLANEGGGPDNITAVVFDLTFDEKAARLLGEAAAPEDTVTTGEIEAVQNDRAIEWVPQNSQNDSEDPTAVGRKHRRMSGLAQGVLLVGLLSILGGAGAWYLSGREAGIKGSIRSYLGLDVDGMNLKQIHPAATEGDDTTRTGPAADSDTTGSRIDAISLEDER